MGRRAARLRLRRWPLWDSVASSSEWTRGGRCGSVLGAARRTGQRRSGGRDDGGCGTTAAQRGLPADLPSLALIGVLAGRQRVLLLGADTGLLSVVSVLASLYPVLTVLLARAMLGERLIPIQTAGVTVALAGVALIATG